VVEIEEFLKVRAEQGLLRILKPVSSRSNGRIRINKRQYIDFSSNDYLGLSGHPKLLEASKKAIDKFGTASSASRLMSGDLELHHKLEAKISQFKNKEAALFFNSGYQANLGILSSLYTRDDCIFFDRLGHASIIDGIVLSRASFFRFQHNDVTHLKSLLKKERDKFNKALIVTETVFSMDGDRAPLKELVYLKEKYNCEIFVDEAHATGIFGKNGSGVVEEEGLGEKIDFIMGTFSKAMGGFGAYLATSKRIVDYLINTCRSFIYSTALPPAIIACNLTSIDLIKEEPLRRKRLLESAEYFRDTLRSKGFKTRSESQIIPIITGDNLKTQEVAKRLQEKGYWVLPVRPPTVPYGEARLRFSLSFNHNKEILERVIDDICSIGI
jgi:8-amino-7-oxononanoate synthase